MKNIPPAIELTAFSCPFCGVLTSQRWFQIFARANDDDEQKSRPPLFVEISKDPDVSRFVGQENEVVLSKLWRDLASGEISFSNEEGLVSLRNWVLNLHICRCYECNQFSVWRHKKMIFPSVNFEVKPNADMPVGVRRDFEEASSIAAASPRGAAALLRLAVQNLCIELGEKGKNINDDIAALVKKGLDVKIQRALDCVRVIGNNAVHPGEMDVSDDRQTVITLFELVNLIVDKMISEPKKVNAMFEALPDRARDNIAKRDGR